MSSRQDLVDLIERDLIKSANDIGIGKLEDWATGKIGSRTYDHWLEILNRDGWNTHLENLVTGFVNESSISYDDFGGDTEEIHQGDLYRTYVNYAQDVLNKSEQELADLNAQFNTTFSPNARIILQNEIRQQEQQVDFARHNVSVWKATLQNALDTGIAK